MRASALSLAGLAAAVLAQLAVPAYAIIRHERVLRTGETFKFRMAPVDPYDAFRGRYIALRFEQHCAKLAPGAAVPAGEIDVPVETGADGFAQLGVTGSAGERQAYLRLRARYPCPNVNGVEVELPFDRFYMKEDIAPLAERLYRERANEAQRDAYATVRIGDGIGVIENVYVEGRPIGEVVREQRSKGQ